MHWHAQLLAMTLAASACTTQNQVYCCTYETRASGCGGVNFGDWEDRTLQFNLEDYDADVTADGICNRFSGSDEECGGGCCINIQYRETTLLEGGC